jgi:SPP1 gp7 family putative phage head morphogenesis protein
MKNIKKTQPLNPNVSVAIRYNKRMRKLIERMSKDVTTELKRLFKAPDSKEYFAMDDSISAQARILMNALWRKYEGLFSYHAKKMASDMLDENLDASASSLKISLRDFASNITIKSEVVTAEIKEVLAASIAENVALIKSIPQRYLLNVQGAVMRSITTGSGLDDLIPAIQKQNGVTMRRARFIAQDQSRKAYNDINRLRMQKIGIKKFEWVHSSAAFEPRPLHKNVLNGKIFDMDNPPIIDEKTGQRGFPAQLINCKCRMAAVLDFGE